MLMMSAKEKRETGLTPIAKVRAWLWLAVIQPSWVMAGFPATKKAT